LRAASWATAVALAVLVAPASLVCRTACVACVPLTVRRGLMYSSFKTSGFASTEAPLPSHVVLLRDRRDLTRRHLGLREGVAQRVVDRTSVQAQREAASRSDDQTARDAVQVGVHIGQVGHVLKRGRQSLPPGTDVREIVARQRD